MAFLINHPFVCLNRKEPNRLSQHPICNRDFKRQYLSVNTEAYALWGRDGTALSQSKGPSGLWPPCLEDARGRGAALPAGSGHSTHHLAPQPTWETQRAIFFFFLCIKAGFSETCGREFLDRPQAGRGGAEHVHVGVLRAQGHKSTP